ncbi:flavin reductase family protein [Paenibacillus sp. Soil724D2]|uniref:flavin reductase family protein n=1 Tax=Paenibacillus sp. (strain Soil724D2) TaxID=1736392 RepID=UPI0007123E9B|nr:flavin reductase family protein [Paenibacillus sp. Soil724D2]KRE36246.1 hypothetical protein ASG85_08655 [Paenibacillus sp. Soil724D2]
MISINPNNQTERDNYKLLSGSILPRPIAFVTTLSTDGILNAAPFSYFNIVTSNPPMLSISVQRQQGKQKDTSRNAIEKGAFVVHISDESNIEAVNQTAVNLPSHESEVEWARLTPVPSTAIDVPGVAEAKIRMECVLEQAIPLGGNTAMPGCDLLIGRIVHFHIHESLYQEGRIDPNKLQPVSRLAGDFYSKLGERFSIKRPQPQ